MEKNCPVAAFVQHQIQVTGKSQLRIAQEAGFEKPNMITMLKQGKTKLPLAKVGPMAKALEADPVYLMKLCMSTYHPDTWQFVEPMLESALTNDEATMLRAWRRSAGTPSLDAQTDESKALLRTFLGSLKTPTVAH